jgi:hypothetical protein
VNGEQASAAATEPILAAKVILGRYPTSQVRKQKLTAWEAQQVPDQTEVHTVTLSQKTKQIN